MARFRQVLCAAAAVVGLAVATPGAAYAIEGGEPANQVTSDWVAHITVEVGLGNTDTCSGSLISSRFVLTAAHCIVSYRRSDWTVTLNYGAPTEQRYGVSRIIPFSETAGATISEGSVDDLALIELDRTANETPAFVDDGSGTIESLYETDRTVVEFGYGRFKQSRPVWDRRQLLSYSAKQAGQKITGLGASASQDNALIETALDFGNSVVEPGRCLQGDSGGPIAYGEAKRTIIGVFSMGSNAERSEAEHRCYYTRVDGDSLYRAWIRAVAGV